MEQHKKESFLIYTSFYKPISILSDKQLGRLFRAIFRYQLGEVVDVEEDIRMAFEFFKNQFEIDESKYQSKIKRDVENGHKGGNPNFKKGKANPYYNNGKKEITQDNPNITQDNPGLSDITQDKANNVYDNDIIITTTTTPPTSARACEDDTSLPVYGKFLKSTLKSQTWLETLAMNYRMGTERLKELLQDFVTDCECRGVDDTGTTLRDFKSHFNNWLLVRLRVEKEQREKQSINGNRQGNGAAATFEQRRDGAANLVSEILGRNGAQDT